MILMVDSSRLKISQLRALVAIADLGNFSEAALELGLSQFTISHAIAALEDELGVVLLKRGRHGANLTPIGETIVSHARQVMDLLGEIATEANRERGLEGGQVIGTPDRSTHSEPVPSGTRAVAFRDLKSGACDDRPAAVKVAAFRSLATHILPTAIARFRQVFPEVRFPILEEDEGDRIERALRQGEIDIGFFHLPASEEFETFEIVQGQAGHAYLVVGETYSALSHAYSGVGKLTLMQVRPTIAL